MSNVSFTSSEDSLEGSSILTIVLIIIAVVGTVGNIAVITAVLVNKRLRTLTNFLLLNLSVADLLISSVAIPFRVVNGLHPRTGLALSCSIPLGLTVTFDSASRASILLIAFERFVAVKWPFRYKLNAFTTRVFYSALFFVWAIAIGFGIMPNVGIGYRNGREDSFGQMCLFHINLTPVFVYIYIIMFCLLPLVIIIPINLYLLVTTFRQIKTTHLQKINLGIINPAAPGLETHKNVPSIQDKTSHLSARKRNSSLRAVIMQSKIAKMVVILVGAFVILVAPISIIDTLEIATDGKISVPPTITKTAVCMIYTNAVINVFIYAGCNSEFRRTFKCVFLRMKDPFASDEQRSNSNRVNNESTNKLQAQVQLLALRFPTQERSVSIGTKISYTLK